MTRDSINKILTELRKIINDKKFALEDELDLLINQILFNSREGVLKK
ncbi:MAG: hypothetical protein ACTSWN_11625 [Promethearchaeota archaeon]